MAFIRSIQLFSRGGEIPYCGSALAGAAPLPFLDFLLAELLDMLSGSQ